MTTLFYKIPPNLPLTKGGMVRQAHHDICHPELVEGWKRGARGDFLINVNSIVRPLIVSRGIVLFFSNNAVCIVWWGSAPFFG
jgi:hypothetical protein